MWERVGARAALAGARLAVVLAARPGTVALVIRAFVAVVRASRTRGGGRVEAARYRVTADRIARVVRALIAVIAYAVDRNV